MITNVRSTESAEVVVVAICDKLLTEGRRWMPALLIKPFDYETEIRYIRYNAKSHACIFI